MDGTLHEALTPWGNFYVVTGTAAASLIGLQFVVQTLVNQSAVGRNASPREAESTVSAFSSPTIVHLSIALLLSTALSVPWPSVRVLREVLVAVGAGCLGYAALVLRRTRRQRLYEPVLEDWVWHVILPALSYAGVLVGAAVLAPDGGAALFVLAAATLVLLFIAIHNAWDTVTYINTGGQVVTAGGASDDAPPDPRPAADN